MTLKELLEQNKDIELIKIPNGNRGKGRILYKGKISLTKYFNYKVQCVSGKICWISK